MFITLREPMLFPREIPDFKELEYPLMAFTKYDGVRVFMAPAGPLSRSMKPCPNKQIQRLLSNPAFWGLDAEITVGPPNSTSTLETTSAFWRTADATSNEIRVFVFDHIEDDLREPYLSRFSRAVDIANAHPDVLSIADFTWVDDETQLQAAEEHAHQTGYEGLILRSQSAPYKAGRTTRKEGYGFKVKRFIDDEATIIGVTELWINQNPQYTDETGKLRRSTQAAGLTPGGTLGALVVQHEELGQFSIGSGFDQATRLRLWPERESLIGKLVTFKYMPYGSNRTARLPIYRAIRSDI